MAAFSIGVMADSLRLPFADSLKKCRELGADGVQLYAVEGEMSPETQTPETIALKRRQLEDNGLEVSALCGDLGGHGFAVATENPTKIERSKTDCGSDAGAGQLRRDHPHRCHPCRQRQRPL